LASAHLAIVKGGGHADRPWRHDFNFRACRVWRLHRDVDRQGNPMDEEMIGDHVDHAARAAKLTLRGIHILRHSFCSHLAMRPAPARAIQQARGHADLRTTQRYMHLSPAALERAIRLLEPADLGDTLETGDQRTAES